LAKASAELINPEKALTATILGVKVSVATTVKHSAGGQFVSHVAALRGNPYDEHTPATVIPQMQALIGNVLDAASPMYNFRRLLAWLRFL
jgi:transposase, IS5 family